MNINVLVAEEKYSKLIAALWDMGRVVVAFSGLNPQCRIWAFITLAKNLKYIFCFCRVRWKQQTYCK